MVFEKNKYKFISETERIKLKQTNNHKNNNKNKPDKNSTLYKDYLFSSPFKNIIKNKKTSHISLNQNNNNKIGNNYKPTNNNNNAKKNNSIKKLKYNKSKKVKNKNNYRSVTKTNNTQGNSNIKKNNENMLIKKLDEKFLSLENNIIDQKYENDIDHDEMIISTNRKHINSYENNNKIKNRNNENKLSNIIGFSGNNKSISDIEDDYFNINKNKDKNNFDIDENYLLNTSFEEKRSDFNIMYSSDYI